jgi:radical SAM protein with 4Fe4S-binding SPASM domain
MDLSVVEIIASQVPSGIVIQLHNNGEGLLYPYFGQAASLFKERGCVTNIVTNGKLLWEKRNEIIENLDTLSVSIIEKDTEADEQLQILEKFLEYKKDRSPFVTLRFVGDIDESKYSHFDLLIVRRVLHKPSGSIQYKKKATIPEIGICWDFMTRLAINKEGDVSVCVRYDPAGDLVIGNIADQDLDSLWNGEKRLWMKRRHVEGKRKCIPYCGDKCEFWGVPTSP